MTERSPKSWSALLQHIALDKLDLSFLIGDVDRMYIVRVFCADPSKATPLTNAMVHCLD